MVAAVQKGGTHRAGGAPCGRGEALDGQSKDSSLVIPVCQENKQIRPQGYNKADAGRIERSNIKRQGWLETGTVGDRNGWRQLIADVTRSRTTWRDITSHRTNHLVINVLEDILLL